MGMDSFGFHLMVLLHLISVIVGFGGVLLNGLYANQARQRPPAEGLAIMEANTFVSMKVAEKFIYAVPIFGFAAMGMSDDVYKFSQTWLWLSLVLYLAALGVSHGVLMPSVNKMLGLQREIVANPPQGGPPPQAAELEALGKKIASSSMVLHLSFAVILILMVWKPGFL